VSQIGPGDPAAGPLTPALAALFALRVITPSLGAVRSNRFLGYPGIFRIAQADPALDGLFAAACELIGPDAIRREALTDVTVALTTEAVALADLSSGRFLNYVLDSRNHVITVARHRRKRYRGHHAWELLCRAGHFPAGTPQTMKEAIREPRLTPAQLVARHDITSTGVRQLIADYLTVRCVEMDYSSLRTLASCLAGTFWKQVEALAPEQGDLNLPGELYERWRETVRWREDGKPRKEQDPVLLAVRSFYFDLATWALQEPAKWAVWVAPCPVPQRELRGIARRRRQVSEEIAGRTRQRQPLLPRLVEQAEQDHALYSDLLAAGQAAAPGQAFTAGGRTWIRVFSKADARREREHGRANVRLRDAGTGQVVHIDRQEERAFWEWAIVETLRHSGIRIEELLEISQLSIRQYRRPNGEVVALLVVAPSKTDRERVMPMSAELFTVIAAIIRRHSRDGATVPVIPRYDPHERETLPPLPYLFQRPGQAGPAVIAAGTVVRALQRLCARIAQTDPGFAGTVSIYPEDVIAHHRAFIARRRAERPGEEYRDLTATEWDEFLAHFELRKVALGTCGRDFGTPCAHENACVRCPLLRVDPAQMPRLEEIHANLGDRLQEAKEQGWLGEVAAIEATLAAAAQKLQAMRDLTTRAASTSIHIGMPDVRPSAGRHSPGS
jgi:hypothetical protein